MKFLADFEKLGESAVKLRIGSLPADNDFAIEGNVWLSLKEQERSAVIEANRSAREAETLSIAKEANALAREANSIARTEAAAAARSSRYAMYAAIIAAIMAIVSTKNQIVALVISWLQ